jgi:hypothetical protein
MNNDETHNGWSNYETWVVNLWIDNDQGSQEFWRENATEAYFNAEADKTFNKEERAALDLMETLKTVFEENNPLSAPDLYTNLLNSALSQVNWHEIAKHLIDAALEEIAYQNKKAGEK